MSKLLLDIVTVEGEKAQLLTQGLTHGEEDMELSGQGDGWKNKAEREAQFPVDLVTKYGLGVDVSTGEASKLEDKVEILKAIRGDRGDDKNIAVVNESLRATFALAILPRIIQDSS